MISLKEKILRHKVSAVTRDFVKQRNLSSNRGVFVQTDNKSDWMKMQWTPQPLRLVFPRFE